MQHPHILIIDLGSQYTLLIGRTLRELGFRSAILSPGQAAAWLTVNQPQAIILSGSHASVYDTNPPTPPIAAFIGHVPILGICYGLQWLTHYLGGHVEAGHDQKEYGPTSIVCQVDNPLFAGVEPEQQVWASHGDHATTLPRDFISLATSAAGNICQAMANPELKIWAVQFHPEVQDTPAGKTILRNFVSNIAGCQPDWVASDTVAAIRQEIGDVCGATSKAVIAFSGGVDSATLAAIAAPVLSERLLAFAIDTGLLRQGEVEEITINAQATGVANFRVIDAADRFFAALAGITDAEAKRAAFKTVYQAILAEVATEFGAHFVLQGTLATDLIESGAVGGAAIIKAHHNTKLVITNAATGETIPELIPLRDLFKYEVRAVAAELALPDSITKRSPFPGPGLGVRIIGQPVTVSRAEKLRWAEAMVASILRQHQLESRYSQLVVALICVPTVGIKGDARAYDDSIVVRVVRTVDFMTVEGLQLPPEVRRQIDRDVTKHPGIVRVWYDENHKPPATTELE